MNPNDEKSTELETTLPEQAVPDEDIKAIEKTEATESVAEQPKKPLQHKFSWVQNLLSTKKRKIIAMVIGVVILVGLLVTIPASRYAIASLALKKNVDITVVDSITKKPVSGVMVMLGTNHADTGKDGVARFKNVPVGQYDVTLSKKYYKSGTSRYTVPILARADKTAKTIQATGRTVTVKVTNKITGKVLSDVEVEFAGTKTLTTSSGIAEVVLAPGDKPQAAKVTKDGYNDTSLDVIVKNVDEQTAEVTLVPKGSIYFLSKRTGKINVIKSNLDGSNQQVIVEGTGNEEDGGTVLLAARDWKNLALLSRREGDKPKLYTINTETKDLEVIDEGSAYFELVGWSGRRFIYKVIRNTPNAWDNKRIALKSYDTETSKLITLDETYGDGREYWNARYENIKDVYILKNEIAYVKDWILGYMYSYGMVQDKRNAFMVVKPDGAGKKRVKEFDSGVSTSLTARLYAPEEIYVSYIGGSNRASYYEYEDGEIESKSDINSTKFEKFYPTYLLSPSGDHTFWYEPRDGKNVLFVGNDSGEDGKEIATLSEYVPYGWLGEQYILMSKGGSELYISTPDRVLTSGMQPLKISDYHKPQLSYRGYGYGYGGQ